MTTPTTPPVLTGRIEPLATSEEIFFAKAIRKVLAAHKIDLSVEVNAIEPEMWNILFSRPNDIDSYGMDVPTTWAYDSIARAAEAVVNAVIILSGWEMALVRAATPPAPAPSPAPPPVAAAGARAPDWDAYTGVRRAR